MKAYLAAIPASLSLVMGSIPASAIELFNGLSTPSQTPNQQGWLYQATSLSPAPTVTATSQGTILKTTGNISNYAGFFYLGSSKQPPLVLNRSNGYTVTFSVKINSQSSNSNNRSGFSVIVMSDRLTNETQPYGIELGFWQSSIWAQNVGFTRGESVSFNTTQAVYNYRLSVKDQKYQLFVNNSSTPILQGSLRQYQYTPPPGYLNPYTTPNLIFLGDNSTSASAEVTLTKVEAY